LNCGDEDEDDKGVGGVVLSFVSCLLIASAVVDFFGFWIGSFWLLLASRGLISVGTFNTSPSAVWCL
jgi:hypothetical protein